MNARKYTVAYYCNMAFSTLTLLVRHQEVRLAYQEYHTSNLQRHLCSVVLEDKDLRSKDNDL